MADWGEGEMGDINPKVWKVGIADEVWKVSVAARDARASEHTISFLCMALTDAGLDIPRGLDAMRAMTGKQIVDALLDYRNKSYTTIARGLKAPQGETWSDYGNLKQEVADV